MKRIYLDYNSSTPIDPRVLKVYIKELEEEGNPSSIHFHGQQCRQKLEASRQSIAQYFGVKPREIIFTSGGTEGASLLLQGFLNQKSKCHVISSAVEHACVYETLKNFEKRGWEVTYLPVGLHGAVNPEDVKRAILPHTQLITLMAANNETGVITDLEKIGSIAQAANVPFIVDGVGWLGKEMILIPSGISALFFSGHKVYGPKGVGFCICRSNLKLSPLFIGGGQENNRRSGTENLPGIIALAAAVNLLAKESHDMRQIADLRDRFEKELQEHLSDVIVNGSGPRICNTSNLSFLGIDGETLLMALDLEGISVSHGSACASGALEPSRVLLEMGIPLSQVHSSLRFSLGRMTTEEEIQKAIEIIIRQVQRLRTIKTQNSKF